MWWNVIWSECVRQCYRAKRRRLAARCVWSEQATAGSHHKPSGNTWFKGAFSFLPLLSPFFLSFFLSFPLFLSSSLFLWKQRYSRESHALQLESFSFLEITAEKALKIVRTRFNSFVIFWVLNVSWFYLWLIIIIMIIVTKKIYLKKGNSIFSSFLIEPSIKIFNSKYFLEHFYYIEYILL